MTRINVTDSDGYGHVVGWFNIDTATGYPEGTRWDGRNKVSLATGAYSEHEFLYHTAGGRWVVNHWSQWQGRPEWYHFVTDEDAREWLIRCEYPEAEVEAATGVPVESESVVYRVGDREWLTWRGDLPVQERGPGRPEIGPAFSVRFPADLLARVDAAAEAAHVSRAGWLRDVAERAVSDGTATNDAANVRFPECPECGAPPGQAHDPTCTVTDASLDPTALPTP